MLGWFKKKFKKGKGSEPSPEEVQGPGETHERDVQKESPPSSGVDDSQAAVTPVPEAELESKPESVAETETEIKPQLEPKPQKAGLFRRLKERLVKTRGTLVNRLDSIFLGKKVIDADLLDELEEVLITADLGVQTAAELLEETKAHLKRDQLTDPQILYQKLKENISAYLDNADAPSELVMPDEGPFVIMVLGVNGVGKTTTIGKIAHKFIQSGQKVLLVAADTFRAAAIEQLKVWGERVGAEVSAQKQGADPSSVVYDALAYAKGRDFDVIIVDTAGRIHTKVNLMEELKKIGRVMGKHLPGAPHEVMLVLDSTTGQNAVSQAVEFNKAVEISGLTLTKLDGTAKGGIIVNISRTLRIPIRFIGIGEQMDDLRDFDPKEFVEALFSRHEP